MKFGKRQQYHQNRIGSNPVYNGKYIKTKIKSYNGKTSTNFHNNKIPKEDCQCICLSMYLFILIDSVYGKYIHFYPQDF